MVLRQVPPLNKNQYESLVRKLKNEEKNPSEERIQRIREAMANAKKMGKVKY